jgi:hypothetical protein
MLWLPAKKKQKKLQRTRRLTGRIILFLLIFFGLGAASVPPEHALMVQVERITTPYQFDFVNWESEAVTSEIGRRWSPPPLPGDETSQKALVQTFLDQERRRNELEQGISQIYAACPGSSPAACPAKEQQRAADLEQNLAEVVARQARIIPLVETILSRQVETVLRDEGFTVGGQAFPPVAFRLIDPPTALILSPRDRIEKRHFVGLQPGLDNKQRVEIETALDHRGDVSSYVTDVGGLGSYPSMVINHGWLPALIEIIAHEWTHNYFYTFPSNMAWGYQTYPKLTTINETAADILGKEIGRRVIERFYPAWVDQLPTLDETGQPVPREPSEFDLAMRRIRQQVDQLLADGQIKEAEEFMEAERLKLVEKGHNLRKLNQAYFAFHGSYALSPASVDPTGQQLRQLRAISPSLKSFLNRVAWLNSYEEYLTWLNEAGIDQAGQEPVTHTVAE